MERGQVAPPEELGASARPLPGVAGPEAPPETRAKVTLCACDGVVPAATRGLVEGPLHAMFWRKVRGKNDTRNMWGKRQEVRWRGEKKEQL